MKHGALKIAAVYLLTSVLWIVLSDKVLFGFRHVLNPPTILLISGVKGFLFVAVTSFLLYKLIQSNNLKIVAKEKQYRVIYEGNPNPMWIYNADSMLFVSVNDAALAKYGYSREEFLALSILDIRPDADREKTTSFLKNNDGEYRTTHGWRHLKKDGSILFVNVSSHKIWFNGGQHVMTMAIDTTEKVLFEQQLENVNKDLEAQQRILKETQQIARIAGWEYLIRQNKIKWTNELFHINGINLDPDNSSISTYLRYVHPKDRKLTSTAFHSLLSEGTPVDIIHRMKIENGEIRYVRQLARMEYIDEKPYKMVGSMQDITELKLLEQERNKYLYNLDDTINSINDIFFAVNRHLEITKTNDKFLSEYNFERGEVIGKKLYEVLPADFETDFFKSYDLLINKGDISKSDNYIAKEDRWMRMSAYPTEEGAAVYLTDITEQKQKDRQLREAVERYDFVAEATKDVIYDYNIVNNYLSYNSSITELTGIKPEDVRNNIEWWRSMIHTEDVEEVVKSQQLLIDQHGHNWECEYRIRGKDGKYKFIRDQGHFLFDEKNRPVRLIGSINDIDDLKRSNEENKRLAGIITRINNMVIVMDTHNRIEWINKAFQDFTGYDLSDIQNENYNGIMKGPKTSPAALQIITQKQARVESFSVELILYTKTGDPFWVEVEYTPTFNQNEVHNGYIGVYQNITQRKQSQEALQRQNNVLREIAWISSHEVRRPVASILGLINLFRLTENVHEKEELMTLLEVCTHELDGIVHSINNKVHEDLGQLN